MGGLADSADRKEAYSKWLAERGQNFMHRILLSKTNGAVHPSHPRAIKGESSVAFHWTIHEGNIHIGVAVEATGWVALGFAEMGGMPGADIVVFERASKKLYDTFSVAYERPQTDPQQDWKLLHSISDNGVLIFEAERQLDTGDRMDWPLTDDTSLFKAGTKLISAWGETDEMQYHNPDNRLSAAVRLFADRSDQSDKELFDSVMLTEAEGSVSIRLSNYSVPTTLTTKYKWKCVTVADLVKEQGLPADKPVHLIGFEFELDSGPLIHHIVLYSDQSETIRRCDPFFGPTSALHVWNRGQSKTFYFPKQVGMLLADESPRAGKGLGVPPKSFRLEIHYENPKKIKTTDSSGVRLHYTTKLREFTGDTLELADPQVKMTGRRIGEGLRQHTFSCPSSCLERHLPDQGVTAFYQLLHMHQTGQTMQIEHRRANQTMDESSVQYYDFGSGGQITRNEYQILPGDTFNTHCTYQGTRRLEFGYEARREMCLATVFYYPASTSAHLSCSIKSHVKDCVSDYSVRTLPGPESLNRTFGVIQQLHQATVKEPPAISTEPTVHNAMPLEFFQTYEATTAIATKFEDTSISLQQLNVVEESLGAQKSQDMYNGSGKKQTITGVSLMAVLVLLLLTVIRFQNSRKGRRVHISYKRVPVGAEEEQESMTSCSASVENEWVRDCTA